MSIESNDVDFYLLVPKDASRSALQAALSKFDGFEGLDTDLVASKGLLYAKFATCATRNKALEAIKANESQLGHYDVQTPPSFGRSSDPNLKPDYSFSRSLQLPDSLYTTDVASIGLEATTRDLGNGQQKLLSEAAPAAARLRYQARGDGPTGSGQAGERSSYGPVPAGMSHVHSSRQQQQHQQQRLWGADVPPLGGTSMYAAGGGGSGAAGGGGMTNSGSYVSAHNNRDLAPGPVGGGGGVGGGPGGAGMGPGVMQSSTTRQSFAPQISVSPMPQLQGYNQLRSASAPPSMLLDSLPGAMSMSHDESAQGVGAAHPKAAHPSHRLHSSHQAWNYGPNSNAAVNNGGYARGSMPPTYAGPSGVSSFGVHHHHQMHHGGHHGGGNPGMSSNYGHSHGGPSHHGMQGSYSGMPQPSNMDAMPGHMSSQLEAQGLMMNPNMVNPGGSGGSGGGGPHGGHTHHMLSMGHGAMGHDGGAAGYGGSLQGQVEVGNTGLPTLLELHSTGRQDAPLEPPPHWAGGGGSAAGGGAGGGGPVLSRQRLYIVVSKSATEEQLAKLFKRFGGMEYCNLKRDKKTNQSKGYCFVNYSTEQSALNAIHALHGMEFPPGSGKHMKVMFSEVLPNRPPSGQARPSSTVPAPPSMPHLQQCESPNPEGGPGDGGPPTGPPSMVHTSSSRRRTSSGTGTMAGLNYHNGAVGGSARVHPMHGGGGGGDHGHGHGAPYVTRNSKGARPMSGVGVMRSGQAGNIAEFHATDELGSVGTSISSGHGLSNAVTPETSGHGQDPASMTPAEMLGIDLTDPALVLVHITRPLPEYALEHQFNEVGKVASVKLLRDNECYAAVKFEAQASVAAAVKALHGGEMCGQTLTVQPATSPDSTLLSTFLGVSQVRGASKAPQPVHGTHQMLSGPPPTPQPPLSGRHTSSSEGPKGTPPMPRSAYSAPSPQDNTGSGPTSAVEHLAPQSGYAVSSGVGP